MPAVCGAVTHAAHAPTVIQNESLDTGPHNQSERRIPLGLLDDLIEQPRLRHDRDERVRRFEMADIVQWQRLGRRVYGEDRDARQRDREYTVGQAHLPEDIQHCWLQRVASEVAIEIAVGLEQRDGDALAGQQQGQHGAGRPAADYAAVRALDDGNWLVNVGEVVSVIGPLAHLRPP
jgi:hypothetical protein